MKTKNFSMAVVSLFFAVLCLLPSVALAKNNAIPNLSGNWIGALCTKGALPLGALVINLQRDSLRSYSGPVAVGIPGLEVVHLSDLQLTLSSSNRVNAVAKGTFMVSDDREFQAQFSFNGDYLATGAIIANGTLHLSGPTESMSAEELKSYIVNPELAGWTLPPLPPLPPKEDIDLNNLSQTIINTSLGNYFGGQDMGSYTLSQDLATYFGGQDMGSYTLTQGVAKYFPGVDTTSQFGGQDLGTYLTKTYVRRFILKDDFVLNVELSQGGSLEFVIVLLPKN